ncbi:MAG: GTPase, partial [Pseudomonadota bacterium]
MPFTLAIVGRPNVGKSTLFNRLVGKRLALVDDQPGVTRDLREGDARLGHLKFVVVDSAGLEEATDDSLQGRMRRLTERAVEMADACLFLIDARVGVTPTDEVFADILRKKNANVILAANKSESQAADAGALEAYALGLGDPLRLSGEHGEGMAELATILDPLITAKADAETAADDDGAPQTDISLEDGDDIEAFAPTTKRPLQVA